MGLGAASFPDVQGVATALRAFGHSAGGGLHRTAVQADMPIDLRVLVKVVVVGMAWHFIHRQGMAGLAAS